MSESLLLPCSASSLQENPSSYTPYGTCNLAPVHTTLSNRNSTSLAVTSPTAIKICSPTDSLKKSQSQLIMPSLLTFLRSSQNNGMKNAQFAFPKEEIPPRGLSREASIKSLLSYSDTSSPEPLIRKCQTVITLSSAASGGSDVATTTTAIQSTTQDPKEMRDKKKGRTVFLRRVSSSKSATFTSTKMTALPKSPSAFTDLKYQYSTTASSTYLCPQKEESFEESSGGCSRCASTASLNSRRDPSLLYDSIYCKLCLIDVSIRDIYELQQCRCRFCKYCMAAYVNLRIKEGDSNIECPDANCDCKGELTVEEIQNLVGEDLFQLHLRCKFNKEIDLDPLRTWCPMPNCETVITLPSNKHEGKPLSAVCPVCTSAFCASCSGPWHPGETCNIATVPETVPLNDRIKRCPRCKVPIERDAGCAQMQCKKCKHVFCWYCLSSLEDDFLLRHYDKGPCKNKLGHSRASVLWHRVQVIGIFAGFGLMLIVASPMLLFVGPCLLCCKCKPCTKQDFEDDSLYGV